MPQNVDSILLQLADDVKMFRAIKTAQDFHCLQSDIDKLVAWCKLWQFNFTVSVICYIYIHLGPPHTFGECIIDGSVMISNETIRDLRVLIDNRLKFYEHVSTVTKKPIVFCPFCTRLLSIWTVELVLLLICINLLSIYRSDFRIWQYSLGTTLHS